jgi:predicted GNAT superfamily acetyltransferase
MSMMQFVNSKAANDGRANRTSSGIVIRLLNGFDDFQLVPRVEKAVWNLSDDDVLPITFIVASHAANALWIGAFEGERMIGFAFGFLGVDDGALMVHSHMLAVLPEYRDLDVGRKLKIAQRERALAMGIQKITWTFDPLQSKNAHLNFNRLGVISRKYKVNFYGPETSSPLHRNGTDRLWVEWHLDTPRVLSRMAGRDNRSDVLDALKNVMPLVQFDGSGCPLKTDLEAAMRRQRIAIEVPSDISAVESKDAAIARQWREATRWAFTEALKRDFVVEEFCRFVRGNQGPGAYLLQRAHE